MKNGFTQYLILILFLFELLPPNSFSSDLDIVKDTKRGLIALKVTQPHASVFIVTPEHDRLQEVIEQVLKLQKMLLINRKPLEEITPRDIAQGFLVGEKSVESVTHSLMSHQGELVVAYMKDKITGEETLTGYAILVDIRELTEQLKDNTRIQFESPLPPELWNELSGDHRPRYIEQIAVHPDARQAGIGSVLVESCKSRSPHGLIADILFEPEPFNNLASYQFFKNKQGFVDFGNLLIHDFPAFKPCKTHVVRWYPNLSNN